MRLIDAPVGLLMYDGCLVFKAEYSTAIQAGSGVTVTPDCYVVESGEYFWGGAKTAEDRNNLNVEPIELPQVQAGRMAEHVLPQLRREDEGGRP